MPVRDTTRVTRARRLIRRNSCSDINLEEFVRFSKMAMMPCVNAAGEYALALFYSKASGCLFERLFGRERESGNTIIWFTEGFVLYMREEVGFIDRECFFKYTEQFVEHVPDLATGWSKVLLRIDCYRSHMGVHILNYLQNNGVVVNPLRGPSSDNAQSCDVQLFGVFEKTLNEEFVVLMTP